MNKCSGCGVDLQSSFKDKIGYIPKEKMDDEKVFCERCFRLLHYNDLKMVSLPIEDVVSTVNKEGEYAFFLVDLLNINSEVLNTFKKIEIPKTLVVSKMDTIPKYMKREKIKLWLEEEYKIDSTILFLSATKNVNVHALRKRMEEEGVRFAYLLGFTLVNRLKEEDILTTSCVPNTTIGYIKIPLEDGYTLIDSPGFQYQNPIYNQKKASFIKKMNPKSSLKPITYQLKKGTSLMIEDVLRIENLSEKCNLTFYMSNLLEIKKVYEKNTILKEITNVTKEIKRDEDIVIKGLGFINVKSNCLLKIYVKNMEWLEIRRSFFER